MAVGDSLPPILRYFPFNDPVAVVALVLIFAGVVGWFADMRTRRKP